MGVLTNGKESYSGENEELQDPVQFCSGNSGEMDSQSSKDDYSPLQGAFGVQTAAQFVKLVSSHCSGQQIPDTTLSFSSATAGGSPLLN